MLSHSDAIELPYYRRLVPGKGNLPVGPIVFPGESDPAGDLSVAVYGVQQARVQQERGSV